MKIGAKEYSLWTIAITLVLLFVNIGPLNAAMANVLPAELRARGFAVTTMLIHLLGDAASPWIIGEVSDRVGLRLDAVEEGAGRCDEPCRAGRGQSRVDPHQPV